jgi:hypothetical protein
MDSTEKASAYPVARFRTMQIREPNLHYSVDWAERGPHPESATGTRRSNAKHPRPTSVGSRLAVQEAARQQRVVAIRVGVALGQWVDHKTFVVVRKKETNLGR